MNLTRIALIFALIALPFSVITYISTLSIQQQEQVEMQYRSVINNAVKDGVVALKQSAKNVDAGHDTKAVKVNPQEVVTTFLAAYHYGFNAKSVTDRTRLNQYVLALVVLDYDGFYLYSTKAVTNPSGKQVLKPMLSEKMPYLYEENGYALKATLGDEVTVLNTGLWTETQGDISTLQDLPPDIDAMDYGVKRQQIIRDSLTDALETAVNNHNLYGAQLGGSYEFYLPLGDGSAITQSVNDVGIMVFIQGYPMGGGRYLDMNTFAKGRILQTKSLPGYRDGGGNLYYCDEGHSHGDTQIKTFSSAEEAAREGFWPCHYVGK